jgi:two-component system, chemotaxis family, protein-glutamate methylesterase/glutaminase
MNKSALNVLIIDDSLMMRTLLKEMVVSEDTASVIGLATNGKEGLDLVKRQEPDLIFLDIEMPVMNGLEFLKRVKLISNAIIVVVTYISHDNDLNKTIIENYGAYKVINKPTGSMSLNFEEEGGNELITILKTTKRNKGILQNEA